MCHHNHLWHNLSIVNVVVTIHSVSYSPQCSFNIVALSQIITVQFCKLPRHTYECDSWCSSSWRPLTSRWLHWLVQGLVTIIILCICWEDLTSAELHHLFSSELNGKNLSSWTNLFQLTKRSIYIIVLLKEISWSSLRTITAVHLHCFVIAPGWALYQVCRVFDEVYHGRNGIKHLDKSSMDEAHRH